MPVVQETLRQLNPIQARESENHSADQRFAMRLKLNTRVVFSQYRPLGILIV